MPHGNQREGPYGPPPIQREIPREMPPYEAPPQYWGPPPPPRYSAHAPQAPRHPPQRVPPPEYHHHHHRQHVAPPPPHHHYSPHHHHYGGPWQDSPERHYYPRPPPPSSHHAAVQRRDMPPPPHRGSSSHEDHYGGGAGGRPYMPMEHEQYVHAPPPPPPRTPPIQFRPTPKTEQQSFVAPPAPRKPQQQQQKSTKTSSSGKKKGDALSLLAKVSTAMADPDEEAEKQKEAEQVAEEHHSPPRTANSPVTMWTPKPSQPSTRSRQITPTHEPSPHHRYFHQPYPRYAPPPPPQQYGGGYGGYRGADSPPAVISERGSFEDPDHRAFGSPSRPPPHHEDNNPHYAPYTYVQQPRLEDKTILRKKFSWKHYPELERFLIANRDEYLRHSALNYTAEQKQYNNWLTERLLEVAARHHYVFCPDDFNFVAVRDRIRCYYKSYVQTARKRGLPLVTTSSAQQPKTQKPRVESSSAMEVTE